MFLCILKQTCLFALQMNENFSYTYTFCISFLKNLSFKTFESTMKFWNKNNNSLFCRCIFHEPQKAKWKGTIVHFSFNAQRSFETIMYYNITYWAKIGMYILYRGLKIEKSCNKIMYVYLSLKNLKKIDFSPLMKTVQPPLYRTFFLRILVQCTTSWTLLDTYNCHTKLLHTRTGAAEQVRHVRHLPHQISEANYFLGKRCKKFSNFTEQ